MYKTYVMHYKPATDRYYFMCNQLEKNNIKNYKFVTDYDKEELTQELISEYYDTDPKYQLEASLASTKDGNPIEYRNLKDSEISLFIKYMKTFEEIINNNTQYALFLEDDCVFTNNQISIEQIIQNAPKDFDAIFIGGGFDINIIKPLNIMSGFVLADHPATNTTSSFILNNKGIKKILKFCKPFSLPVDWHLNYAFKMTNSKVYHTLPYICGQAGSQTFDSLIGH